VLTPKPALPMSRRHKEYDVDTYKPQQAESHADGSPRDNGHSFLGLSIKNFTITKRDGSKDRFSLSKITDAILAAFEKKDVDVDDEWVKIPRSYFEEPIEEYCCLWNSNSTAENNTREKPHKGRSFMSRLIHLFDDSEPIRWFKEAMHEVKTKAKELYVNMTQFSVCFLKSLYEAFLPHGDPYQSISHYHRMLEHEVSDLPSRVTINRNYKWFVEWRKTVTYEDRNAKRERLKHRIWERLVEWIKEFLLTLAPQYAAQPISGVGI